MTQEKNIEYDYQDPRHFTEFLHQMSGLNEQIAMSSQPGKSGRRSVLLEVNPIARVLPSRILTERQQLYCLFGEPITPGFDAAIRTQSPETFEGIAAEGTVQVAGTPCDLRTIILSHLRDRLDRHQLSELIASGALALAESGSLYVLDERGWGGMDDSWVRDALSAVQDHYGERVSVRRCTIAPEFNYGFAKKIAEVSAQKASMRRQCFEIMEAVLARSPHVHIAMREQSLPLSKSILHERVQFGHDKVTMGDLTDELFVVRKFSEEEAHTRSRLLKEARRREKAKRKKR